mmetsp:Transcript_756/g.2643  ORF Transcript_756/g.2643 Transcript_756/m.2643 type:complete len:297 (+) Transcript_756:1572-2462(+)
MDHAERLVAHPGRYHPARLGHGGVLAVGLVVAPEVQNHPELRHLVHPPQVLDDLAALDVNLPGLTPAVGPAEQAVELLGPREDLHLAARLLEELVLVAECLKLLRRAPHHGILPLGQLVEPPRRLRVRLGCGIPERQLLELVLDVIHAEELREGREHEQGLPRNLHPLLGLERSQRAHVVQPVGQLDDDDPHVLGHRQEHLLQVVRLHVGRRGQRLLGRRRRRHRSHGRRSHGRRSHGRRDARRGARGVRRALLAHGAAHLAYLGLPLHDPSHRGSEPFLDGLERDRVGVLHGVVK